MIGQGKDPLRIRRLNKLNKVINDISSVSLKKLARKSNVNLDDYQCGLTKLKLAKYVKSVLSKSIEIAGSRKTITLIDILKGVEETGVTTNGF